MIEKIQLELTTKCNLNCEYCLKPQNIEKIEKEVIETVNGLAKKFVLYGYGEPFLHERIAEFVKILDGELVLSTNGMIEENFAEVSELVDIFGISIDLDDKLRKGMELNKVLKKIEILNGNAIVEFVLTAENIKDFTNFAEKLAVRGIDIMATNLIAANSKIYSKTLYFEGSRTHADFLDLEEDFVLKMLKARKFDSEPKLNLALNFCALLEAKDRIRVAKVSEELIGEVEEKAESYGVHFINPEFFGEAEKRECPYSDSLFIRADGFISPCMPFAYSHEEFVNRRCNRINEFLLGHLNDGIDDIIERKRHFEKLRKSKDFPWCGDCGYSEGCWYLENGMDCYANRPSCSQCLYSTGIAKCLI